MDDLQKELATITVTAPEVSKPWVKNVNSRVLSVFKEKCAFYLSSRCRLTI